MATKIESDGLPTVVRKQRPGQLAGAPPAKLDEKMMKSLLLTSLEHGDAGEPINLKPAKRRVLESEEPERAVNADNSQIIFDILDTLDALTERVLDLAEQMGVEIE